MEYRGKLKKSSQVVLILTGIVMLSGCNYKEQVTVYTTTPTATAVVGVELTASKEPAEAIQSSAPTRDPKSLEIEAYWIEFVPQISGKYMIPQEIEEKPLRYYEEGLRNSNPLIRWYCTYKITDYAGSLTEMDHQTIDALLEDLDYDVQKAASFTKSLLEGTYEGDGFERSTDGKVVAYYKFREARYNDGKVYWVRDGVTQTRMISPSVTLLTISPNNQFLLIENGGRIWTGAQVMDISTDTLVTLPNLVMDIIRDPKNGYDTEIDPAKIDRFDDWTHFKEWSPEGDRLMYSYEFTDEKRETHAGFAVLDLKKEKITKVYPRKLDQDPLEGFSWDAK